LGQNNENQNNNKLKSKQNLRKLQQQPPHTQTSINQSINGFLSCSFNLLLPHQGAFFILSFPKKLVFPSPFCPKGLTLHLFHFQKDLSLSAFSSPSSQRCHKHAPKRITCSVAAPQQTQRQPSSTGSVCFFAYPFGFVMFFLSFGW